jgi:acyl-CoA synthetase (AMP-forming)/AMP-acid ligase II
MGEVGCAFAVVDRQAGADADALIGWANERLANFKVPRHIVFVDALPRNATGKVLKHELRDAVPTHVQTLR